MKSMSYARKQNLTYFALVLLAAICTIIVYHLVHQDWITFREAEDSYANKDYEKAIVLYKKSIDMGVPFARIAPNLANVYVTLGRFEDAIAVYKQYLSEYPNDSYARLEYAKVLTWSGHLKEAEEETKKLLENSKEKK